MPTAAFIPLALVVSVLGGCAAGMRSVEPTPSPGAVAAAPAAPRGAERPRWFLVEGRPIHAVALVLHGLNLKPSKMDFLASRLASLGIECYRPVLTGHEGDLAAFKRVSRNQWQDDVARAYEEAAERARRLDVPLHLVGFSLGGLLAIDLIEGRPEVTFDRMVLFAPAVAPRLFTRLTRGLGAFPSFVLPSAAPVDYRVHSGTPIAAYSSLLSSVNAVASRVEERTNRPTMVLLDPGDELLSKAGLDRFIRQKRLTRWRVVQVSNLGSTLEKRYHHLIIDEQAVGAAEWARIERLLELHLRLDRSGTSAEWP